VASKAKHCQAELSQVGVGRVTPPKAEPTFLPKNTKTQNTKIPRATWAHSLVNLNPVCLSIKRCLKKESVSTLC